MKIKQVKNLGNGKFETVEKEIIRSRHDIYCDILHNELIMIRVAGWQGNAEYCARHADHIHNIPTILTKMDCETVHEWYWNEERGRVGEDKDTYLQELWDELAEATEREVKQKAEEKTA